MDNPYLIAALWMGLAPSKTSRPPRRSMPARCLCRHMLEMTHRDPVEAVEDGSQSSIRVVYLGIRQTSASMPSLPIPLAVACTMRLSRRTFGGGSRARNEDLLTMRPTLGIPRLCHNA